MKSWVGAGLLLGLWLALCDISVSGEPDLDGTLVAFEAADSVPPIRVLLGGGPRASVVVRVAGPYRWEAVAEGDQLAVPEIAGGESMAETTISRVDGGWKLGALSTRATSLRLVAKSAASLWVGDRRYRGSLRLVGRDDGKFLAINEVDLENYLASVVSGEMPANFPRAAQEAQVIAARTYALFHAKTRGGEFDLYDNSRSQTYRGVEYRDTRGENQACETDHSRGIVGATRGQVLLERGRLFCAYYSAVCGGHSANGAEVFGRAAAPLAGRPCDGCRTAPHARWERRMASDSFLERLRTRLPGPIDPPLEHLTGAASKDPVDGHVPLTTWRDGERSIEIPATVLYEKVLREELLSPFFSVALEGNEIIFQGRGWGHGVGLCQWGSKGLAERGLSTAEILAHYYPGSTLGRIGPP